MHQREPVFRQAEMQLLAVAPCKPARAAHLQLVAAVRRLARPGAARACLLLAAAARRPRR